MISNDYLKKSFKSKIKTFPRSLKARLEVEKEIDVLIDKGKKITGNNYKITDEFIIGDREFIKIEENGLTILFYKKNNTNRNIKFNLENDWIPTPGISSDGKWVIKSNFETNKNVHSYVKDKLKQDDLYFRDASRYLANEFRNNNGNLDKLTKINIPIKKIINAYVYGENDLIEIIKKFRKQDKQLSKLSIK